MTFLTHIRDLSVFVVEPSEVQSQFMDLLLKKSALFIRQCSKMVPARSRQWKTVAAT